MTSTIGTYAVLQATFDHFKAELFVEPLEYPMISQEKTSQS